MSNAIKTSFLEEVKRLFNQGRPSTALEMLYRFSDIAFELKEEKRLLYWRQRAIAEFLTGGANEATQALAEAGGATEEFLNEYKNAYSAFTSRRPPRINRHRIRRDTLIRDNLDQITTFVQQLGEVGQKMDDVPKN